MDCPAARERMAECLGEGLPEEEGLIAHMASCASCREELARMRRAFALAAGSVADFEPSPKSWERLSGEMAALSRDWERRAALRRRIAIAAAFAAPVLAAVLWLVFKR